MAVPFGMLPLAVLGRTLVVSARGPVSGHVRALRQPGSAQNSGPAAPRAPTRRHDDRMSPQHRVVLLRHGQTEWSESGRHTGRTDIPLTAAGREQAKDVEHPLARLQLAGPVVLSSPRIRAVDTAELAGLTIAETTEDLAEWDYGEYEGRTTERIRTEVPGWTVWTHPCPGGETANSVQQRADAVLARAVEHARQQDVVLVGHGHFSRALLARWVALPVANGIHFRMSAGALAVLGHEHGHRQIAALNITATNVTDD